MSAGETSTGTQVAKLHPQPGDRPHVPTRATVATATRRLRTTHTMPGATRALMICQGQLILADIATPSRVEVSVIVDERGRARAARLIEPRDQRELRACLLPALLGLRLPAREEVAELRQQWDLRFD